MYFKTFQIPDNWRKRKQNMYTWYLILIYQMKRQEWTNGGSFFEAQPRFDMTHDECLRIGTRRERESDGEFYESFNSC